MMPADRLWILLARKLSDEASPEELCELEELLRLHPDGHFPIDTVSALWQQKKVPDEQELEAIYARHLKRMEQAGLVLTHNHPEHSDEEYLISGSRRPAIRRYLLWAVAAMLVISMGAWLFFHDSSSSPIQLVATSEISTKNGSKSSIRLPDGSSVWLNAGSKLTYDKKYGNDIREVTLTGEGYFDVVKNPEKPFIIHTVAMDVKVLGTVFNVRSYPGDKTTEATLIRGSIEVSFRNKEAEKIILKPNEKIIVSNENNAASLRASSVKNIDKALPVVAIRGLTYDEKDSTILETAWVENKLSFHDESLGDIARRMERWYGVKIQFGDEEVQKLHFTGTFKTETVQEALKAIKTSCIDLNYSINGNDITIK